MKFHCTNCRFDFNSESEAPICPRCSSKHVHSAMRHNVAGHAASPVPAGGPEHKRASGSPGVFGDTKGAWKAALVSEQRACPDCGGVAFDFNWKRKEKTCKKCGHILPLGRRL